MTIEPLRWPLADGRELLFFSLPGHVAEPCPDRRALPGRAGSHTELRYDRQTGEWVVIAALRQNRTYKPAPDQCPLCPGPSGISSEVPASDYDVVVFENRFPSLAGDSSCGLPDAVDGFTSAPGNGHCEVIAFSSDHTGRFADLDVDHALLVAQA
ncbi:MAG: galactose-1-phosphate uridylyltransferase, partial [Mycobacterium sp.]